MKSKKRPNSPKPFKCWFIYRDGKPFCGPYSTKGHAEHFCYRGYDETVKPVTILPRPQK